MNKQQAHGPFSGTAEAFFQSANSYKEVLQRMCAPQSDIVFFDFETTGIDKSQHPDSPEWCGFPVQIGMVRVQGGERVGQFMEFMNPGKPLSDWCRKNLRDSDGNLLTDAWLASKRPYDEVLRDALNFLGDSCIVGGQNCTFDVGVMRHSLQRMGELERWKVTGHVDSLFISQAVLSGQSGAPPSFGLENLNRYFGLPAFAAHDAAEDSFASWLVLRAALQRGQSMQEQGTWGRAPALPPLLTPNVTLSDEQTHLQQLALEGRSMFITGGAGTGKSFLLASIVTNMQLQRGKQSCVVLSPTGAAAVLVKGRTIHSFFSLGIPKTWSCFDAVQTGRNSAWLKHRLTCIIFDEISMVSAEMLDLLDVNIRAARSKPDQPFGGLQVLMFGDFFQLPPIVAKQTAEANGERVFSNAGLAFESHFWKQLQPQFFNLKRSFRQQDDQLFLDALQRIRVGDLNARDRELLCAPKAPNPSTHAAAVVPTKLFCHREKVDNANNDELAKLPGHLVTYTAHDSKSIVFEMQPPAVLHLKIGAQVMLVKNLDVQQGLVNGSRGVVVAFQPVVSAPPHEQSDAQAQLATDIERMSLQGDVQQSVEAGVSLHPVVRFDCMEQLQIMAPLAFEFDENEFGKCSFRRQVPLTLAWAISIHKAQGMSISNLEVDCQGAWADGQVHRTQL
jgi:ATP-dependent DNA helicase PIF1